MLAEMSKLISLPILSPLKKSLRSREEIRAYLLQKMKEDKDADKRYADQKTMEKFGLLPKDYPLDQVLVKVLTEQIAGLYDPDSQEFFIADWTTPADERPVMSHELTHALQDQHFHIDKWTDAAKPNDDGELARDAVIEGSAMAAMLDYELGGKGSIRDLGDFDPALLMGDLDSSPELSKAPKVLQDELLFPYLAGITFTQHLLKAGNGWPDFYKVFDKPPVSTQQIMHPDLYLQGVVPAKIDLPATKGVVSSDWKKLDENDMGEFGVQEILKQFLPKNRSTALAAAWSGDRYAIFENQKNKRTLLVFRIRLASDAAAARFFGAYSEILEMKYDQRTNLMRRPNFFSFDTRGGWRFPSLHGLRLFRSRRRHPRDVRSPDDGNGMAGRTGRAGEPERSACQRDRRFRFTRACLPMPVGPRSPRHSEPDGDRERCAMSMAGLAIAPEVCPVRGFSLWVSSLRTNLQS